MLWDLIANVKTLLLLLSLAIATMGAGCVRAPLVAYLEPFPSRPLACDIVDTPASPHQNFLSQRLQVFYSLPSSPPPRMRCGKLTDCSLRVTARFSARGEDVVFAIPLERLAGLWTLEALPDDLWNSLLSCHGCRGEAPTIVSYKVELMVDKEVVSCQKHPLWHEWVGPI